MEDDDLPGHHHNPQQPSGPWSTSGSVAGYGDSQVAGVQPLSARGYPPMRELPVPGTARTSAGPTPRPQPGWATASSERAQVERY